MRCGLDGPSVETLVCNGVMDKIEKVSLRHCVGVAIDVGCGLLYWSQRVSRVNSLRTDPLFVYQVPSKCQ